MQGYVKIDTSWFKRDAIYLVSRNGGDILFRGMFSGISADDCVEFVTVSQGNPVLIKLPMETLLEVNIELFAEAVNVTGADIYKLTELKCTGNEYASGYYPNPDEFLPADIDMDALYSNSADDEQVFGEDGIDDEEGSCFLETYDDELI